METEGEKGDEEGITEKIPGGLDTLLCVQVAQRQEDQDTPCFNTTADPDLPVPAAPRHATVSDPPDHFFSSSLLPSSPPCPPCLRGSTASSERETGQATPMGPRLPHVPAQPALRLGMRMVSGLSEAHAKIIEAARQDGLFISLDEFTRRTGLTRPVLAKLSEANAFGSLAVDRRQALWDSLGQETKAGSLPLLSGAQDDDELPALLPPMPDDEQVLADYLSQGLSLRAHPMQFHRELLTSLGIVSAFELATIPNGRFVRTAGVVLVRQRPGTAKGITFVTLEDETGSINLIIKQDVWQKFYRAARTASALIAHGRMQSKDGVTHVLVSRLMDLSEELGLQSQSRDFH
jgi:DNA polymerase III alpha subunit